MRKVVFSSIIGLFICFIFILPIYANLNIYFLDVGQGDSSLIICPTGRVALIDSGPSSEIILNHLRDLKIDRIDLIIASHAHADHITGMDEIIAQYKPRAFIDPGLSHTTTTYERMIDALVEYNINYYEGTSRQISLGDLIFTVMPPAEPLINISELNNNSTVVRLDYYDFSVLYTGDIEKDRERSLLNRADNLLDVNVLKIPHHGSSSSSSAIFVKATNPEVGIISCGENNTYNHPNDEVLSLYSNLDINIYRTDQHGTILVQTDGSDYTIHPEINATCLPMVKNKETKQDNSLEYKYAASKKSKVFHYIDCNCVKQISLENLILFKTREEAIASDRRPCKRCNP